MNERTNPFEPPRAEIEPLTEEGAAGELLAEPRKLPAERGMAWIGESWELFKTAPGLWIVMLVVLMALWVVVGFIPIINMLAAVAFPLFMGGWAIGCHRAHTEGEVRFEDLFAGFSEHFAPLIILGLIYLAASVAMMIVGAMITLPIIFAAATLGEEMAVLGVLMMSLVMLAITIPLMMTIWFAPALVVLNGQQPVDAMKLSFKGCLRNILPFLLYGVVMLGLMIVGMIPLLLGLLVVMPMFYCSVYTAYRDIFIEE